jgi:hypothetical protein
MWNDIIPTQTYGWMMPFRTA